MVSTTKFDQHLYGPCFDNRLALKFRDHIVYNGARLLVRGLGPYLNDVYTDGEGG